jgi:hypothetical protein
MANTLVECVKNLFGSEQELTNYELCLDNSCLCYMSAEPICTDREIVDKFCPQEWFAQDSGVASTTTTTVTSFTNEPSSTNAVLNHCEHRCKKLNRFFYLYII